MKDRVQFFRGMLASDDGKPVVGTDANMLGARTEGKHKDVTVQPDGTIRTPGEGISGTSDPERLPPHLRPTTLNKGLGGLKLFVLNEDSLPASLVMVKRPTRVNPAHCQVEPACDCLVTAYQQDLASTRDSWG